MHFLKKSARKKCQKKVPKNRNFDRKNRKKHPIHSTNQQSQTIVGFSYGGKHESNKRNKNPS